jgi:Domain of unknown function (DUF397)
MINWRKSSRSMYTGNCIEVSSTGTVNIRDSGDRGTTISITVKGWVKFTNDLRAV